MRFMIGCVCLLLFAASNAAHSTPLYKNSHISNEARIQDLVSRMTLEEKITMLGGDESAFATKPIPRLGIPSIQMTDGPLGVRMGQATAFPSGISLAASFDPELMGQMAKAMGTETLALGRDMLLGPCINISRNPFGGRNFESFGEDPYLTSRFADSYVRHLQAEGVMASTKHFALNDQEHKRYSINVVADERTMQEIHLPAFQTAVQAGTWSVMSSYNLVNGHHASENKELLTDLLKNKWGFQGFVVSDWESVYSTAKAANAGLDLEMPTANFFDGKLLAAVRNGEVTEATINDKVTRILRGIIGSGLFDSAGKKRPDLKVVGSAEHLAIARKAAAESFVLLKNENTSRGIPLLPFQSARLKKVALLGPGAVHSRIAGGGSSMVNPTQEVSPLDAFSASLPGVQIRQVSGVSMRGDFDAVPRDLWSLAAHSRQKGVKGEYFDNMELKGKPMFTRIDPTINFDWGWNPAGNGMPLDKFSVRWTGFINAKESGNFRFLVRSDDGVRLYVNDKLVLDAWTDHGEKLDQVPFRLEAGKSYKIKLEYYDNRDSAIVGLGFVPENHDGPAEAVRAAAESDVAVFFAGLSRHYEGETIDLATMSLPDGQDELIRAVAKANPNTVVVITGGNPVLMPWINEVKAVVHAWYPGQEGSVALTDALLGKTNFSGKLPVSFPKRWEDASAFGHYPEDHGNPDQVTYGEGIYVGYRHFDTHKIEPLFPFGYGLSYTTFGYGNLSVTMIDAKAASPQVEVEFDLTNTGKRTGAEVPQLFVRALNPLIDRPFQELKGFERVELRSGETRRIKIRLNSRSFAYYDVGSHDWRVDAGQYELRVGGSSRDIQLTNTLNLL